MLNALKKILTNHVLPYSWTWVHSLCEFCHHIRMDLDAHDPSTGSPVPSAGTRLLGREGVWGNPAWNGTAEPPQNAPSPELTARIDPEPSTLRLHPSMVITDSALSMFLKLLVFPKSRGQECSPLCPVYVFGVPSEPVEQQEHVSTPSHPMANARALLQEAFLPGELSTADTSVQILRLLGNQVSFGKQICNA